MVLAHHKAATYQAVDITADLWRRDTGRRDETPQLLALSHAIARQPANALAALTQATLDMTGAESAGISVVAVEAGEEIMRWVAAAGRLAAHLGAALPRYFSPCGDVLRTGSTRLMSHPAVHYPYIADLPFGVSEALLAPVWQEQQIVGTLWAVFHEEGRHFDAEHGRILGVLSKFAGETGDLIDRLSFGTGGMRGD